MVVFRLIKKILAVLSFALALVVLWLVYLIILPHVSSGGDEIHGRFYSPPPINLISPSSVTHKNLNAHYPINKPHLVGPLKAPIKSSLEGKSFSLPRLSFITHLLSNTSDLNNLNSEKGKDILSRIKTDCSDRICSGFLTNADGPHFKYCMHKKWKKMLWKMTARYWESPLSVCVFINGSNRYPMALASYPGSGNTWVRGLLQKVTGLCIGGIYCDVTLRWNGYPGESLRSGVTFMVKTHQIDPRWEGVEYAPDAPFTYFKRLEDVPVFSGGVFIMRNPFHAMVAEFKRKAWEIEADHHVKTLGWERFGE